jgi:hypothetical protein
VVSEASNAKQRIMETRMSDPKKAADELASSWVLVATNSGTLGAAEACRTVGCGEPRFATVRIYEQVGTGSRRVEGPDPDMAPGYLQRFTGEIAEKQRQLAKMRKAIRGK